jgi:hypothetical protein
VVEADLSRTCLSALVKDGFWEHFCRGAYVPAGEVGDKYFAMGNIDHKDNLLLETAFFYELTNLLFWLLGQGEGGEGRGETGIAGVRRRLWGMLREKYANCWSA